jgi:2-polyprenyl-3-methyl-5-hydroxy-6-metoxy-1,4-benzoquinol methylase
MESIDCIFCRRGREDPPIVEENGFVGRKCGECGLVYISPRPPLAEIVNLYAHDHAHISARHHIAAARVKRAAARHHLAVLRRYVSRGSLLEIGPGAGHFLDEARRLGFDPYGIELNEIQAAYLRDELGIPCETRVLAEAFSGRCFDVIYHADVISHFYDPIAEFHTMSARMNPGGIMIFETGNGGDIERRFFAEYSTLQYPDHLFFYSERNLRDLLARTGFELLSIIRWAILPQLRVQNLLRRAERSVRRRRAPGARPQAAAEPQDAGIAGAPAVSARLAGARAIAANASDLLSYVLRYKVGAVFPKHGRPQSIMVVARKAGETDQRA